MLKINRDWAVGGGLFIGLGTRFFLLTLHALYFVGSIFLGLGIGLLTVLWEQKKKKQKTPKSITIGFAPIVLSTPLYSNFQYKENYFLVNLFL